MPQAVTPPAATPGGTGVGNDTERATGSATGGSSAAIPGGAVPGLAVAMGRLNAKTSGGKRTQSSAEGEPEPTPTTGGATPTTGGAAAHRGARTEFDAFGGGGGGGGSGGRGSGDVRGGGTVPREFSTAKKITAKKQAPAPQQNRRPWPPQQRRSRK